MISIFDTLPNPKLVVKNFTKCLLLPPLPENNVLTIKVTLILSPSTLLSYHLSPAVTTTAVNLLSIHSIDFDILLSARVVVYEQCIVYFMNVLVHLGCSDEIQGLGDFQIIEVYRL